MSRRIPLVIMHLRLEQMTEILFAGFEAELYSLEEIPFLYWYTSTVILSRQVETLDELCREIHPSVPGSHDGAYCSFPPMGYTDLMGIPMILSGPRRGSLYSHSIYDSQCIKGNVGGCLLGTSLPFHTLRIGESEQVLCYPVGLNIKVSWLRIIIASFETYNST
jgi:hypothetical protein